MDNIPTPVQPMNKEPEQGSLGKTHSTTPQMPPTEKKDLKALFVLRAPQIWRVKAVPSSNSKNAANKPN